MLTDYPDVEFRSIGDQCSEPKFAMFLPVHCVNAETTRIREVRGQCLAQARAPNTLQEVASPEEIGGGRDTKISQGILPPLRGGVRALFPGLFGFWLFRLEIRHPRREIEACPIAS